ncbi:hypothetical protein [Bacillus benzoevorans]|uniref:Uncharacterized protein n=1 Tax=Bacillus benzoevorans TaxID=1456 RepID=A0A7X0HQA1_9BACI|nr:hypothetical protein [Bacillus benzoevorans]MBB6443807.1 hypothetical protein [Bacillus benzoevorans]
MRKYIKGVIVLVLLFFAFCFVAKPVFAESTGVNVKLEAGMDGKVKTGRGFPLQITVENTGPSFNGDLLIDYYPSHNTGGTLAVHLDLPKNSTKTYIISVPGMTPDHPAQYQKKSAVHLYSGDWKDGKEVSFSGNKTLPLKYIEFDKQVIGIISGNIDRLKELKTISTMNNRPIEIVELQNSQIPKQALGLEMIDYLLVDDYILTKLNDDQQEAIRTWVNNGGVFIAGGSPHAAQSFGKLAELLPIKMNAEVQVNSGFLKDGNREDPAFNELTVFTGSVEKDAEVVSESGGIATVMKKNFGMGTVMQTGFSLGDEPLASWKGYGEWFYEVLMQGADKPSVAAGPYGPDVYGALYYEFAEINEYFPASHFSIWQLVGLLLGYFIILVPILYFILKKLDKREHAWWIIPSLSIVMSAAIFGIGAKDRIANPRLNQMGIYVNHQGYLTGYQAATLLSNKSGTYSLEIPKDQFKALPSTNMMMPMPSAEGVIEEKRKEYEVVFQDVEYWSSRTLYGDAKKESDGSFQTNLTVANDVLKGTIQNEYPYDFNDIVIWTGRERLSLGPLKKGEVLKVNEKVKQSILSPPTALNTRGYSMPGGPGTKTDMEAMKKERLEYAAGTFLSESIHSRSLPVLAGFTNDEVIALDMTGEKEKKHHDNLIVEPFEAEVNLTGDFTLTTDGLVSSFNVINGRIIEKTPVADEILLEEGQYEYVLQLPKAAAVKPLLLKEILIRTKGSQASFELYNYQTAEYVPIEKTTVKITAAEQAEEFMAEDGKIMLKITKQNNGGDPFVILPDITIKGEVLP